MKLRKLEIKDAPLMLAWMHDENVTKNMAANFAAKTIDDCLAFISSTKSDTKNCHLAIVDENDRYMGTVSLKNITNRTAEFAITVSSEAMGKGFSKYAIQEIIRIGTEEKKLQFIYWYVSEKNARAVRFYDKNGYKRVNVDDLDVNEDLLPKNKYDYLWYINE